MTNRLRRFKCRWWPLIWRVSFFRNGSNCEREAIRAGANPNANVVKSASSDVTIKMREFQIGVEDSIGTGKPFEIIEAANKSVNQTAKTTAPIAAKKERMNPSSTSCLNI